MEVALVSAGHVVTVARTMDSALFVLAWEKFDAIVCDLLLSDGHGCDIVRFIRRKNLPIYCVAVSGLPRNGCEDDALEAGFDAFLPKPFFAVRPDRAAQ